MKKTTSKFSSKGRDIGYISASRTGQYLKCKKQYFEDVVVAQHDQYDGDEEIKDAIQLSFGSAVHKALELFWKEGHRKKSELINLYRQQYVEFGVGDPDYHTLGLQMMEMYWYNLKHNTPKRKLVATEQFFSYSMGKDIKGEDVTAQGTIDVIWYLGNGLYEIEDYKTSAWLPSQEDVNANIQIAFYDLAFRSNPQFWYKGIEPKAVILSMNYLRFEDGKIQTEVDDEDRELYRMFFIDTYNQMKYMRKALFLPRVNIFCPNCGVHDKCPAYKEILKGEFEDVELEFDEDNFADNLATIEHYKAVIKVLQREVDDLNSECIDYMKQNDADVIVGDQRYYMSNYTKRWLLPTVAKKILEKHGLWKDKDFITSIPVGKVESLTKDDPECWSEIEHKALKRYVGEPMLKHSTVKQTELFSTHKNVKNKKNKR